MSNCYEIQVLLIPRLPQALVVTFWGVGGDLHVCVCVPVCLCPYMREGVMLEKRGLNKERGQYNWLQRCQTTQ